MLPPVISINFVLIYESSHPGIPLNNYIRKRTIIPVCKLLFLNNTSKRRTCIVYMTVGCGDFVIALYARKNPEIGATSGREGKVDFFFFLHRPLDLTAASRRFMTYLAKKSRHTFDIPV